MKPLVIYHDNCADGFGAAFAAWTVLRDDAEYLPMQYGYKELPDFTGRIVYILDFSLKKEDMDRVFEVASYVVWLDHHKSAFEMWYAKFPLHWEQTDKKWIRLDNNKSGAFLAWEYFTSNSKMPMLIKHIDDRDRWQFRLKGTKELNAALWSYRPWTFEQWNEFDNRGVQMMINEGRAILRAHEQNVKSVVENTPMKCSIQLPDSVHIGLISNCPPHLVSDVGHELSSLSTTYGVGWYMNKDGRIFCSFRSNGAYDVSSIAKEFGGGGHRNAAGCEITLQQLKEWANL